VLSPKSHANVSKRPFRIRGSRSVEDDRVACEGSGRKTAKAATGGAFTTMIREVELVQVVVVEDRQGKPCRIPKPLRVDGRDAGVRPSRRRSSTHTLRSCRQTSEEREASNVTLVPGETRLVTHREKTLGGYTGGDGKRVRPLSR